MAEPEGRLTPELVDWDGDLLLEPSRLVPAWHPWEWGGKELTAEERAAHFRFELDLLLQPTTACAWTAQDVLRALLRLRALWRQE